MSDAENLMISSNLVWTPPVVGISQTGPKSEFLKFVFAHRGSPRNQLRRQLRKQLPQKLCFTFFLGPRNRTMHFKILEFRLGPDLVILSTTTHPTRHFLLLEHCVFSLAPTPSPRSGLALCGFRALCTTGQ
jgi:hypothetical protein